MTTELIERLRELLVDWTVACEAADTIEAQAAEINTLKQTLEMSGRNGLCLLKDIERQAALLKMAKDAIESMLNTRPGHSDERNQAIAKAEVILLEYEREQT